MDVWIVRLAAGLYLAATVLYLLHLYRLEPRFARGAFGVLCAAFLLHTVSFVVRWVAGGHFPVTTIEDSLSFFSWALAGGYIGVQYFYSMPVLGAFVSPLNLMGVLYAAVFSGPPGVITPALRSGWLSIHATTSFVGYAAFALSFVVSVLYLVQERYIKSKSLGWMFRRLPSLHTLDSLNYRMLTVGFPFLTIGIITGAIWAEYAWGSYWSWDPKETWSLITWFIYAAILHGRMTVGWRGRRAAILAIVGFAAVLFTFLGVNLLLPGLHTYANM